MPIPIFLRKRADPTAKKAPGPKPGVQYLVNDMFLDAQPPGRTSGVARPGGSPLFSQAWTGVDTNAKISQVNGLLNFATGAAANDGRWWASHPRLPGQAAMFKITFSGGIPSFGWDTNATGAIQSCFRLNGASLQASEVASFLINIGTVSTSVAYIGAIVFRAAGYDWYIKGGSEYPRWILLLRTNNGAAAGYPAVQAQNATSVFTCGFMRTPQDRYIAPPCISDGFGGLVTVSDGLGHPEGGAALGAGGAGKIRTGATWANAGGITTNSPTLGPELMSDGGFTTEAYWTTSSTWTVAGGVGAGAATTGTITENVLTTGSWYSATWDLASVTTGYAAAYIGGNCVARTTAATYIDTDIAGNGNAGIYGLNFSGTVDNLSVKKLTLAEIISPYADGATSPDYLAGIKINRLTTGAAAGAALNLDSTGAPANGLLVWHNGTNIKLYNLVSGTYSPLLNVAHGYTTNTTLWVHRLYTAVRLYAETSAGVTSLIGAATATTNTNLYVAVLSSCSTNALDDLQVYPAGTSGEYEAIFNRFIE